MNYVLNRSLIYAAVAGMLLNGWPIQASQHPEHVTRDVILADNGVLYGTVIDPAAQPLPETRVEILYGQQVVATTQTTTEGHFSVQGLRHGAHSIRCSDTYQPVRFWETASAPPNAVSKVAVVVSPDSVVRGQTGPQLNAFLLPGLLIGGAVAITLGTTLGNSSSSRQVVSPVSP